MQPASKQSLTLMHITAPKHLAVLPYIISNLLIDGDLVMVLC